MTAATLPQANGTQQRESNPLVAMVVAFTLVSLLAIGGLIFIAISVTGNSGMAATMEVLRDLFVILLAFELLLLFTAFTLMLVQVARLANMLQNEVRPIIDASTETVNTVRGTAAFLSQHLVEPVKDANAVIAGAQRAFKFVQDLGSLRDIANAAFAHVSDAAQTATGPPRPD